MNNNIKVTILIICIIMLCVFLKSCNTYKGLDTAIEIFETIDEREYKKLDKNENKLVLHKQNSEHFKEQYIEIYFDVSGLVEEIIVKEKHNNRDEAKKAYDSIVLEGINNDVVLEENSLSYNATEKFGYRGKSKTEVLEDIEQYEANKIFEDYIMYWEKD